MERDDIRVKIDEKEQKELFRIFLKKFNNDFNKASDYLGVTRSSLSKYKRNVMKYISEEILLKVVDYLKVDSPEILYSGSLREIRKDYMKKAHHVLETKYGNKWAKELTSRRDFTGIHLSDFPDYIFIYLESDYRKQLLESAYCLFGSLGKLAQVIDVSPSRLSSWFYGEQKDYKTNRMRIQFIPLKKMRIISKYLVEDHRDEFSIRNIEKHVLMYIMQAGNPIKNPRFPIKESSEMVRLLFHLLGDGYSGRKGDMASYKNTCQELLDEFKTDLMIFGDVSIYEQKDSIKFPRVLAEIIENFYGINSRTFDSKISDKISQIPKKNLYFGIRAFADDEASVYSHSIRITSANYNLLEGVRKILHFLKIKSNDIKFQSNPRSKYGKVYYLNIRDLEEYKRHIGFIHPKKKKLLINYVKKIKSVRRKRLLKS